MKRCWGDNDELLRQNHDDEWGVVEHGDNKLFELLVLEMMQAGLSWLIVLKKRDAIKHALAGFDIDKVVRFGSKRIERLLKDDGIIRNRAKLEAVVHNARLIKDMRGERSSFSDYVWDFVSGRPIDYRRKPNDPLPVETDLSRRMSREMKKRGFKFVGPKIIQEFIQAAGLVNAHAVDCFRYRWNGGKE